MRSMTIGVFDGVHVGHTYIAQKTIKCAKKSNLISTAMIFMLPYKAISDPNTFDGLLTTPSERVELLKKIGINEIIVKDLEEMIAMEPFDFVKMLVEDLNIRAIHVGHDFKFGKNANGDTKMLEKLGGQMGFSVDVIPKIIKHGNRISSSMIRYELKIGRPEIAKSYLGRHFSISGEVFRERGIGSKIGFPTANLRRRSPFLIVPKYGVYLVKSKINGENLYGVMNIGKRPTVDKNGTRISYEVHFIEKRLHLLGQSLKVKILRYMRPEIEFPTLNALKNAITKDVEMAKSLISSSELS